MTDLNVKFKATQQKENVDMIKRLTSLGWGTIAWNTTTFGKIGTNTQKQMNNIQLEPLETKECLKSRQLVCEDKLSQIRQLNRITVTVDEMVDAQTLTAGNEQLKLFDIVAACPGNAAIFAYLCKTAQVDVICVDFTRRVPFPLIKKQVRRTVRYFKYVQ